MLNDGNCSCRFPVTQTHLGDALGLTAAHVNRVLRRLRQDGLASVDKRSLIIHDAGRLAELCEFSRDYTARLPAI